MISVCIATYNGEEFIKEQLTSILSQLSSQDEVIISDDNSSDNTIKIIESINSPIIHIFKNDGAHGYTSNFENAVKRANGDYIFLSDQDDVWAPNKVEITMNALQNADFVVSDAYVVDEELKPLYDSFYLCRKPYKSLLGNIFKFGYLGCCFSFRKDILTKALPFPGNHKKCTHDNWLFIIAKTFFRVTILNDKLIYYRRHNHNISGGGMINSTSMFFKLSYRIYLVTNLIHRLYGYRRVLR